MASPIKPSGFDTPAEEQKPITIFVCYRRDDSSHAAGRIYDRLVAHFGEERVFMDVDAIPLGVDFRKHIDEAVSRCDVLIAVIGQRWLARDEAGRRRIDDPHDYVRIEIATALHRNIRVIPALVGGAAVPAVEELPEEIQALTVRNGLELHHQRFHTDVTCLIEELTRLACAMPLMSQGSDVGANVELAPSGAPIAVTQPRTQSGVDLDSTKPKANRILLRFATGWAAMMSAVAVALLWGGSGKHPVDGHEAAKPTAPVGAKGAPSPVSAVSGPGNSQRQPAKPSASELGDMVRIPAGSFLMGSNDGDADGKPVHRVRLRSFEMDVTEVTVANYQACVQAKKSGDPRGCDAAGTAVDHCNGGKAGREKHPINCVDWNQSRAYCLWAGKRLPTEEEWEYAARGTDSRLYPWGNEAPKDQLCWRRSDGTCEVGSFHQGKSPFGVLDMAGNVWEWTETKYRDSYAESKKCTESSVNRGGGWSNGNPSDIHAAYRDGDNAATQVSILGFRCAR